MKKMLSLILALVTLLLAGCTTEPEMVLEDHSESRTWEKMPSFTFGQMETEKLAVVPWYDGRLESTSGNTWAETKDGYYSITGGCLYYADRVNLDLWVPVCNQPNCPHTSMISWSYGEIMCNCHIGGNAIWIREGRIWFAGSLEKYPELRLGLSDVKGTAIFSVAPDGTDPRLEYRNDAMELPSIAGGSSGSEQGSRYILTSLLTMDINGLDTLKILLLTDQGAKIVHEQQGEDLTTYHWWSPFNGDDAFYVYAISPNLLRLEGDELIPLDVSAYEANGGYLSGNFLRQFRSGDGYYDINLITGEEVKLCDPRMESSIATIQLPNCVVEHNLNATDLDVNAPRSMEFFDGEVWRTVELPEELRYRQFDGNLYLSAVASDRLLFSVVKFSSGVGTDYTYYQVLLDKDTLTMELCGYHHTH